MSNYPKYQIQSAIANQGEITIPPKTPQEAGLGRLSQENGWGIVNAQPIEQGGIPPNREDFNGVLFLLSQFCLWYQQGGIMNYSALLNYEVGNEVLQNGIKYRCISENGPSSKTVAPGSDRTVWKNMDITVPAGAIMPFSNVQLGGSDNRRPIFWGSTQADEGWILCDGGDDGRGGVAPNLIDKFIKGVKVENIGNTGGSSEINIPSLTINGTVGETALTVAQLPAHSHVASTNQTGDHAHTRGSMNIMGTIGTGEGTPSIYMYDTSGAFTNTGTIGNRFADGKTERDRTSKVSFDASRSWVGQTSTNGLHSHTVTVSNTGSGQTHTHSLNANASITGVSNEPPFYSLVYFMKLPE